MCVGEFGARRGRPNRRLRADLPQRGRLPVPRPAAGRAGRPHYRELWPETVTDGTLPIYCERGAGAACRRSAPCTTTGRRVAGHFEIRVVPCGDGFVARFVDLTKLTMRPRSEAGARLYEALDAAFDGFTLLRAVRDATGEIVRLRLRVCQPDRCEAGRQRRRGARRAADHARVRRARVESGLLDRYREVADGGQAWRQQVPSRTTVQTWEIKIARVDVDVVAVSYRDITEQVEQQEQLARSAVAGPRRRRPYRGAAGRHRRARRRQHPGRGVRRIGCRRAPVGRRARHRGAAGRPGPADAALPRRLRGPCGRPAARAAADAPLPRDRGQHHRPATLHAVTGGVRQRPNQTRANRVSGGGRSGMGVPAAESRPARSSVSWSSATDSRASSTTTNGRS